jgi:hypothetical protein
LGRAKSTEGGEGGFVENALFPARKYSIHPISLNGVKEIETVQPLRHEGTKKRQDLRDLESS